MRFRNKVSPTSKYFPPAGPANAGHGMAQRLLQSCSCMVAALIVCGSPASVALSLSCYPTC
jgi:hypothetical protein